MRLSVCTDMIFTELKSYGDRIRAAADAGAAAIEFHLWRDKPIDGIEAALRATGLGLTGIICDPRRSLADRALHAQSLQDLREAIAVAVRLGAQTVLCTASLRLANLPMDEQRSNIIAYLRQAAPLAAIHGVTLVIEPVNDIDHAGAFLVSTREGLDIVEAVGLPNVKLLWDIYHSNVMKEPLDIIARRGHLIAHVQAADFPGRHQPGTGTIDWPAYLALLNNEGYNGALGLEYRPDGDAAASIRQAAATLHRHEVGACK